MQRRMHWAVRQLHRYLHGQLYQLFWMRFRLLRLLRLWIKLFTRVFKYMFGRM